MSMTSVHTDGPHSTATTTTAEPGYDVVYRCLHWSIAAAFLAAAVAGFWAAQLPAGTSPRREILEVHKSLGFIIFAAAILRLAYRLAVQPPAYPASLSSVVRWASTANHWVLYGVLFAMPLTGYIFSAAGGYPLRWFWLFDMPRLLAKNAELAVFGKALHATLAWVVYGAVGIHVLATLWHSAILKDGTLRRMIGSRRVAGN